MPCPHPCSPHLPPPFSLLLGRWLLVWNIPFGQLWSDVLVLSLLKTLPTHSLLVRGGVGGTAQMLCWSLFVLTPWAPGFSKKLNNAVVVLYRAGSKWGEFCRERGYLLLQPLNVSVIQFLKWRAQTIYKTDLLRFLLIFWSLLYMIFINICFCETCLPNVCDEEPLPQDR